MFNKGYRILSILRDIIFKISWKQTFLLIENSRSSPKIIFSKSRSFKKYSISNDTLTKKFHEAHFKTIVNLLVKKDYNCLDLGAHITYRNAFNIFI